MRLISLSFLFAAALLILLVASAGGVISQVGHSPEFPTSSDVVTVFTEGYGPSTCYHLLGAGYGQVGDTFVYQIDAEVSGSICFLVIFPWSYSQNVGPLAPGEYVVMTFEQIQTATGTIYNTQSHSFRVVSCSPCLSGDTDGDGTVNVADLTFLVDYLFNGQLTLPCHDNCNIDGSLGPFWPDIADLTYLVNYLFLDGPPPVPCS